MATAVTRDQRDRRHRPERGRRWTTVAAALTVVAVLASGCVEQVIVTGRGADGSAPANLDVTGGQDAGGESVVARHAGEVMSFGTIPDEPVAAGDGEPIRIGMINQENTPLGSFSELRLGAEAAVEFINTELGGVGGRPIELIPCITTFSPEKSRACAQQLVEDEVVAVTGGIDITSNGSIPVLEQNGVPFVGGIPINFDEMRSPISFQFSGGIPGAFTAFAYDAATRLHADKVAVAYGDFGSIKSAGVDYGIGTLNKLGVTDVTDIPFPITTTDFLPILTKANEGNPDAIFLGAADAACAPAMKTAHELGITATIYLVGACAAPTIAEQVGPEAVEGRIFNIEGPDPDEDIESPLYFDVIGRYGDPQLAAVSAATVSFRSVMNLYATLVELGPDDISRQSIIDHLRAAEDHPSFTGHPYTCDGKQLPDLPALCAPQQLLVQRQGDGVVPVSDWIDVPSLVQSP